MADYTVISRVSKKILELLQQQMVPELIGDAGGICLCSPEERKDVSLGIFLYDMKESEEIRRSGMVNTAPGKQAYPPIYLELYYMITAYVSSDLRFRLIQEEKILGKVVQYFHDYPVIPISEILPESPNGPDVRVMLSSFDAEQKMKLWNFGAQSYRLSLFYKVSPVMMSSAREKDITRVTEVEINVEDRNDTHKGVAHTGII